MPSIPQHTAQGITAVNDGVGRQIHRDAQFLIVSSPTQNALLRLPSGTGNSWEGQTIEGYVGANGFTLTGATSINGASTYQVPPNYYFSVTKGIGSLWIIEIVDNLGTGGGASQYASSPAPAGYRWDFVTDNGIRITDNAVPVVDLVRIN